MKVGEYVKFKRNKEPCIQYKVLEEEVIEYDDLVLNKYCPMVKLEVIGLIPTELLVITDHKDNIPILELAIELTNMDYGTD